MCVCGGSVGGSVGRSVGCFVLLGVFACWSADSNSSSGDRWDRGVAGQRGSVTMIEAASGGSERTGLPEARRDGGGGRGPARPAGSRRPQGGPSGKRPPGANADSEASLRAQRGRVRACGRRRGQSPVACGKHAANGKHAINRSGRGAGPGGAPRLATAAAARAPGRRTGVRSESPRRATTGQDDRFDPENAVYFQCRFAKRAMRSVSEPNRRASDSTPRPTALCRVTADGRRLPRPALAVPQSPPRGH